VTAASAARWKQEFDAIYAEGGYFNLTVHPRVGYGSASPARCAIVERLIEYIKPHRRSPSPRCAPPVCEASWSVARTTGAAILSS
jgi:hypothetical protein